MLGRQRSDFVLPKEVLFFFHISARGVYEALTAADHRHVPPIVLYHGSFAERLTPQQPLKGRRHFSKMPLADVSYIRQHFALVPESGNGSQLGLADLAAKMSGDCVLAFPLWRAHGECYRYLTSTGPTPWNLPGLAATAPAASQEAQSELEVLLQQCAAAIHQGESKAALDTLSKVQSALQVTAGRQSRKKGGWQYAPQYILHTVLLADEARDIERLPQTVAASWRLSLHPMLVSYLESQAFDAASKNTVLRSRISVDLASMVYCRDVRLPASGGFITHLRVDSSPQFSRDYCVMELDILSRSCMQQQCHLYEIASHVHTRLMPLQVMGVRATSTMHKAHYITTALRLESGSLPVTCSSVFSILCDMGVERGLWAAPNLPGDASDPDGGEPEITYMFARHLPLADSDHALHHAPWPRASQHWMAMRFGKHNVVSLVKKVSNEKENSLGSTCVHPTCCREQLCYFPFKIT